MDRETAERIWNSVDATRDREEIDLFSVVQIAAPMIGDLHWRDVAELALRLRREESARPIQLLEFIAELARALRPDSILDPWVMAPTILAAASETSESSRNCGLVKGEGLWKAAQRIAPLDWRLGDPLVLLRDLPPECFDLMLIGPPFGGRGQVSPVSGDPSGRVELEDLVLWRAARMMSDRGAILFHTTDNFFWAKVRRRLWTELAQRGLYPRAVISIDPALTPSPSSFIESSLVLFTGEMREQLFLGRLERDTSVPVLARNLIAEHAGDDPRLGVMAHADTFGVGDHSS